MYIIHFWKSLLWLIVIILLSIIPGEYVPDKGFFVIPYFDKLMHGIMYLVLTILLIPPFFVFLTKKRACLLSAVLAVFIGGIIEFFQLYIAKNRCGSMTDFYANIIGILFGVLFYHLFISNKKREVFCSRKHIN
jgi:VanZ family protein